MTYFGYQFFTISTSFGIWIFPGAKYTVTWERSGLLCRERSMRPPGFESALDAMSRNNRYYKGQSFCVMKRKSSGISVVSISFRIRRYWNNRFNMCTRISNAGSVVEDKRHEIFVKKCGIGCCFEELWRVPVTIPERRIMTLKRLRRLSHYRRDGPYQMWKEWREHPKSVSPCNEAPVTMHLLQPLSWTSFTINGITSNIVSGSRWNTVILPIDAKAGGPLGIVAI